ncbi:hypothetical protein AAG570_004460 [Ranatra chinensis]|uniref:Uncharacterized protein n=1 Tax=Ranatra chinensis TaxID=642074 RepID=A0ABD0Y1R0_9HEMI
MACMRRNIFWQDKKRETTAKCRSETLQVNYAVNSLEGGESRRPTREERLDTEEDFRVGLVESVSPQDIRKGVLSSLALSSPFSAIVSVSSRVCGPKITTEDGDRPKPDPVVSSQSYTLCVVRLQPVPWWRPKTPPESLRNGVKVSLRVYIKNGRFEVKAKSLGHNFLFYNARHLPRVLPRRPRGCCGVLAQPTRISQSGRHSHPLVTLPVGQYRVTTHETDVFLAGMNGVNIRLS